MNVKSQMDHGSLVSTENRCVTRHPAWCDLARCTADLASQSDGFRPGVGGEHRSAPIPLPLTTAVWLPVRDGTAWLTEAFAPWQCTPYLQVQAGDLSLSMPAEDARQVLDALSTPLASTTHAAEEVTR